MMNLYTYGSAGSDSTPWEVTATSLAAQQGQGRGRMAERQSRSLMPMQVM